MVKGLISCVIATYNTEKALLKECVLSILNQSYNNIEVIIIDDGSSYSVEEFVKTFTSDKRIRVYKNEKNCGVSFSRNKAMSYCNGEFVAVMDSDDISVNKRFELQINYFKTHKKCDLVSSQMELFSSNKKKRPRISLPKNTQKYRVMLFWDNSKPFPHGPAMIRMSFLKKNNINYDVAFIKSLDYKMWVDCAKANANFRIINKYLYLYRVHSNQISQKNRNDQIFFADRICLKQLSYLKIIPSEFEVKTHLLLRDSSNLLDLNDAKKWALRLISANDDAKEFRKKYFDAEVKYRLFKTAYNHYIYNKNKENKKKMMELVSFNIIYRLIRIKLADLLFKKPRSLVVKSDV